MLVDPDHFRLSPRSSHSTWPRTANAVAFWDLHVLIPSSVRAFPAQRSPFPCLCGRSTREANRPPARSNGLANPARLSPRLASRRAASDSAATMWLSGCRPFWSRSRRILEDTATTALPLGQVPRPTPPGTAVIIDFEGEPLRPLASARKARRAAGRSPGCSPPYALRCRPLRQFASLARISAPVRTGRRLRAGSRRGRQRRRRGAVLAAYFRTRRVGAFLPEEPVRAGIGLCGSLVREKGLYEIAYELPIGAGLVASAARCPALLEDETTTYAVTRHAPQCRLAPSGRPTQRALPPLARAATGRSYRLTPRRIAMHQIGRASTSSPHRRARAGTRVTFASPAGWLRVPEDPASR